MAIKISGSTIIDDSRVIVNADKIGIGTPSPTRELSILSPSSNPTGIGVSAASAQSTDVNKAISVFNAGITSTFAVSYTGVVTASEYFGTFKGSIDTDAAITNANKIKINHTSASNDFFNVPFFSADLSDGAYGDIRYDNSQSLQYNPFLGNLRINSGAGNTALIIRTTSNELDRAIAFQNSGLAYVGAFGFVDRGVNQADLAFFTGDANNNLGTLSETMRLTKENTVGIGTTRPEELLDVFKSSNDSIIKVRTSTAGAYFEADSAASGYYGIKLSSVGTDKWFLGSYNSANFQIKDGSAASGDERFTIQDGTGKVGINSTVPTASLEVLEQSADTYGNGVARFKYFETDENDFRLDVLFKTSGSYHKTFATGAGTDFLIVDKDNVAGRHSFAVEGDGGNIKSLTVDSTGLVGIGTDNPGALLDVAGNINVGIATLFVKESSGRVGINTDNPGTLLHIQGVSGDAKQGLRFRNQFGDTVGQYFSNANSNSDFVITYTGTGGAELTLHADGDLGLNEGNGDDVFIGTSSAEDGAKLTIKRNDVGFATAIALSNSNGSGDGSKIVSNKSLVLGSDHDANHSNEEKNHISFQTRGVEKVRINVDGDLLRGGTSQDIGASGAPWDKVYANEFIGLVNTTQENITTGNLLVTGIATFQGNVSIAGTLTYEDVTNVDAIGLITARNGIHVTGAGVSVTGISTFHDKVGIGNTVPNATLEVNGPIKTNKGTYKSPDPDGDQKDDTALVMPFDSSIYTEHSVAGVGTFLRTMIGVKPDSTSQVIQIGQSGTALIDEIRMMPGNAGFFSVYNDNSEALRITSGGQIGLKNSSPKEWHTDYKTIQIYDAGYVAGSTDDSFVAIGANNYLDTGGTYDYCKSDFASQLYQVDGELIFRNAASGTADNAITWSEKLRIDSTGAVRINTTRTTATKLHVVGGTASGTSYDTAIFAGGQNSTAGSGARIYLTGCENDPLIRGVMLQSLMTDNGNTHDFIIRVGGPISSTEGERLRITTAGNVGIGTNDPIGANALANNNTTLAVGILTANTIYGNVVGGIAPTGNVFIGGNLDVDGTTTLDGLTVSEAAVFQDNLTTNGMLTISNNAPILKFNEEDDTKAFFIVGDNDTLSVRMDNTGGSDIIQKWNSNGTHSFYNTVTFNNDINANEHLDVDGTANLDDVNIAGIVTVSSGAFGNNVTVGERTYQTNVDLRVSSLRSGIVVRNMNNFRTDNTNNSAFMVLDPFTNSNKTFAFRAAEGTGANDITTDLGYSTPANNTATLTDTFWVKTNGDGYFSRTVGIGTSSPASVLHIHSGTPRITMSDSGTNAHHRINADSSVGNFNFDIDYNSVTSTPAFIVNIKGGEKVRINSDGDLLRGGTGQDIGASGTPWDKIYANEFIGLINTTQENLTTGNVTTGNLLVTGISTFVGVATFHAVGIGTDSVDSAKLEINVGSAVTALDIQGSEGQLFSVTNNLTTGSIFAVNDVSGTPSINVDADGTIQLAPFLASDKIGIGTTNPASKLHVNGKATFEGDLEIYQNGVECVVESPDALRLKSAGQTKVNASSFNIKNIANNKSAAYFQAGGAVTLNFDDTTVLETMNSTPLGDGIKFPRYALFEGDVGIKTDNPDAELHVRGQIKVDDSNYARVEYARNDTNLWSVGLRDTDDFFFYRESGSANVIFQHGDVGIGTDNPTGVNAVTSGNTATLAVGIVTANEVYGTFKGTIDSSVSETADLVALGNDSTGSSAKRIAFTSADSGNVTIQVDTDAGVTYTPSSGTITAQQFSGGGSGLTGVTNATTATNITAIDNSSTDTAYRVPFLTAATGTAQLQTDNADGMSYNPNTGELVATKFSGTNIVASGRVLIGTNSSRATRTGTSNYEGSLQIESNSEAALTMTRFGTTHPSRFNLQHSRGTIASPSAAVNNDDIGQISFSVYDGSNFTNAAEIIAEVDGIVGVNSMPGRLIFKTTPDNSTTATERVRIEQDGKLRIGTASPIILTASEEEAVQITSEIRNSDANNVYAFRVDVDDIDDSVSLTGDRRRGSGYFRIDAGSDQGDTSDELIIQNLVSDVNVNKDYDTVRGIFADVNISHESGEGTISNAYGVYSDAQITDTGAINNIYGGLFFAKANGVNATSAVSQLFGIRAIARHSGDNSGNTGTMVGVRGEVQIRENIATRRTATNAYSFYADLHNDNIGTPLNEGNVVSNRIAMYYGDISGSERPFGRIYGLYLTEVSDNYLAGNLEVVGVTTVATLDATTINATTINATVSGAASQITVADESSDTTCFPVFTTAATGNQAPKTGSNLTFNSSTGQVGASLLRITGGTFANTTGDETSPTNVVMMVDRGDYIYTHDSTTVKRRLLGKSGTNVIELGHSNTSHVAEIRMVPGTGFFSVYNGSNEKFRVQSDALNFKTPIRYGSNTSTLLTSHVYVRGTAHNNTGVEATRVVTLNGEDIIPNDSTGIGLVLVVLNAGSGISTSSITRYNTHSGGDTPANNMATAITAITRDQIGIIASYDACMNDVTDNLRTAAQKVGLFKLAGISGHTGGNSRLGYAAVFRGTSNDTAAEVNDAIEVVQAYSANAGPPTAVITTHLASFGSSGRDAGITGAHSVSAIVAPSGSYEPPLLQGKSTSPTVSHLTIGAGVHLLPSGSASNDTDSTGVDLGGGSNYLRQIYVRTLNADNITGTVTGAASQVTLADDTGTPGDDDAYVTFSNGATGNQSIKTNANLRFNASAGILNVAQTGGGIKFGPGNAANDDGHIEWKGGTNGGYLRISTSDDSDGTGTNEHIEFGDYPTVDRGGTFVQHLRIARDQFLVKTGGTSGTEDRFIINSNGTSHFTGKVGIGTTDPDELLHIQSGSPAIKFQDGTNLDCEIRGDGGNLTFISNNFGQDFIFQTSISSSHEVFRIHGSGGIAFGGVNNYGSSGQVLTSNGQNSAPTWVNSSTVAGVTDVVVTQQGRSDPCTLPITVDGTSTKTIGIGTLSNAFGAKYVSENDPTVGYGSSVCDGDIWYDTSGISGISTTSTSTNTPLVISDVGKLKLATGTGDQFTVPADVFSPGDYVSFHNHTAAIIDIVTATNVTIYLSGSNVSVSSGDEVKLSPRALATLTCIVGGASPQFVISGGGVYI